MLKGNGDGPFALFYIPNAIRCKHEQTKNIYNCIKWPGHRVKTECMISPVGQPENGFWNCLKKFCLTKFNSSDFVWIIAARFCNYKPNSPIIFLFLFIFYFVFFSRLLFIVSTNTNVKSNDVVVRMHAPTALVFNLNFYRSVLCNTVRLRNNPTFFFYWLKFFCCTLIGSNKYLRNCVFITAIKRDFGHISLPDSDWRGMCKVQPRAMNEGKNRSTALHSRPAMTIITEYASNKDLLLFDDKNKHNSKQIDRSNTVIQHLLPPNCEWEMTVKKLVND